MYSQSTPSSPGLTAHPPSDSGKLVKSNPFYQDCVATQPLPFSRNQSSRQVLHTQQTMVTVKSSGHIDTMVETRPNDGKPADPIEQLLANVTITVDPKEPTCLGGLTRIVEHDDEDAMDHFQGHDQKQPRHHQCHRRHTNAGYGDNVDDEVASGDLLPSNPFCEAISWNDKPRSRAQRSRVIIDRGPKGDGTLSNNGQIITHDEDSTSDIDEDAEEKQAIWEAMERQGAPKDSSSSDTVTRLPSNPFYEDSADAMSVSKRHAKDRMPLDAIDVNIDERLVDDCLLGPQAYQPDWLMADDDAKGLSPSADFIQQHLGLPTCRSSQEVLALSIDQKTSCVKSLASIPFYAPQKRARMYHPKAKVIEQAIEQQQAIIQQLQLRQYEANAGKISDFYGQTSMVHLQSFMEQRLTDKLSRYVHHRRHGEAVTRLITKLSLVMKSILRYAMAETIGPGELMVYVLSQADLCINTRLAQDTLLALKKAQKTHASLSDYLKKLDIQASGIQPLVHGFSVTMKDAIGEAMDQVMAEAAVAKVLKRERTARYQALLDQGLMTPDRSIQPPERFVLAVSDYETIAKQRAWWTTWYYKLFTKKETYQAYLVRQSAAFDQERLLACRQATCEAIKAAYLKDAKKGLWDKQGWITFIAHHSRDTVRSAIASMLQTAIVDQYTHQCFTESNKQPVAESIFRLIQQSTDYAGDTLTEKLWDLMGRHNPGLRARFKTYVQIVYRGIVDGVLAASIESAPDGSQQYTDRAIRDESKKLRQSVRADTKPSFKGYLNDAMVQKVAESVEVVKQKLDHIRDHEWLKQTLDVTFKTGHPLNSGQKKPDRSVTRASVIIHQGKLLTSPQVLDTYNQAVADTIVALEQQHQALQTLHASMQAMQREAEAIIQSADRQIFNLLKQNKTFGHLTYQTMCKAIQTLSQRITALKAQLYDGSGGLVPAVVRMPAIDELAGELRIIGQLIVDNETLGAFMETGDAHASLRTQVLIEMLQQDIVLPTPISTLHNKGLIALRHQRVKLVQALLAARQAMNTMVKADMIGQVTYIKTQSKRSSSQYWSHFSQSFFPISKKFLDKHVKPLYQLKQTLMNSDEVQARAMKACLRAWVLALLLSPEEQKTHAHTLNNDPHIEWFIRLFNHLGFNQVSRAAQELWQRPSRKIELMQFYGKMVSPHIAKPFGEWKAYYQRSPVSEKANNPLTRIILKGCLRVIQRSDPKDSSKAPHAFTQALWQRLVKTASVQDPQVLAQTLRANLQHLKKAWETYQANLKFQREQDQLKNSVYVPM